MYRNEVPPLSSTATCRTSIRLASSRLLLVSHAVWRSRQGSRGPLLLPSLIAPILLMLKWLRYTRQWGRGWRSAEKARFPEHLLPLKELRPHAENWLSKAYFAPFSLSFALHNLHNRNT